MLISPTTCCYVKKAFFKCVICELPFFPPFLYVERQIVVNTTFHLAKKLNKRHFDCEADALTLGWANYGTRAACGPRDHFMRPTGTCRNFLTLFGSTYICEQAFSSLKINKSKNRSLLTDTNLHDVMRISTSKLAPVSRRL